MNKEIEDKGNKKKQHVERENEQGKEEDERCQTFSK
jgi:hypothetical protein